MLTFLRSGGIAMIVLLALSAILLVQAFVFARDPHEARAGALRQWERAVAWATAAATAFNITAVCRNVPAHPEWSEGGQLAFVVLTGLGESLSPLVLGAAVLAVAATFGALGWRRLDAR